jgi:hypothetical protein
VLRRPRRAAPRLLLVALVVAMALPAGQPHATAQGEVRCPPSQVPGPGPVPGERICYPYTSAMVPPLDEPVRLRAPAGGGATERWCLRRDDGTDGWAGPHRVLCHSDGWWYTPLWDCHIEPGQAEAGVEPPRWNVPGGDPGQVWRVRCYPPQEEAGGDLMWSPPPPVGGEWVSDMLVIGPADPPGWLGTPAVVPGLWVEAINALGLSGPQIITAPPLDTAGLVRLPTWLWTGDTARTWPDAPLHARADARPDGFDAWVDVWAEPLTIAWDMGDDTGPTTCDHGGVPWRPGMDDGQGHGECSHRYLRPSRDQVGGTYLITAVTTWRVWWEVNGGADSGALELRVGSTADYRVVEVQVLVGQP